MTRYVALLRAVNVSGHNMVSMPALRQLFESLGYDDVSTYIQSGNVIFRAAPKLAATMPKLIPARITERFGHRTPVILRTPGQLGETVRNNPFLKAGAAENTLHVAFLADAPPPRAVEALDPDRSPPDQFIVRERDIYLRLPNGGGRTKLTNSYFDSKLGTVSTIRNWRTVLKLLELLSA